MVSLSDKSNQVQLLCLLLLFSVLIGQTPIVSGSNVLWDSSDLIVEGKITKVWIQDGEPIGISAVSRVIKTSETTSIYTKGLVHGSEVIVRSPDVEVGQNQRLYLEKLGDQEYRVIKAVPILEERTPVDYGSIGFVSLALVVVLALNLNDK